MAPHLVRWSLALVIAALIGLMAVLLAGRPPGPPPTATPAPPPVTVVRPTDAAGGASAFAFCAPCHRPDGQGAPGIFPPLAGSRRLLDDPRQAVAIVLSGFDSQGAPGAPRWSSRMMPLAHLPDQTIADALTHARSSWGNQGSAITPELVAAMRARHAGRQRAWTPADLVQASAP